MSAAMIPWLELTTPFPDVADALTDADGAAGLLAAGADLSPGRLLSAYRNGIFPWFSEGEPILWWSTDPRMVLMTEHFKISNSLQKTIRKVEKECGPGRRWEIRFDSAFEGVMRACAQPRWGKDRQLHGTWISEDIVHGYRALHQLGYAHSSELWCEGELVGGAYGVCIGRMFYGESMFTRISDGSKIALAYLVQFLRKNGVSMIDCQQETAHLASLGAAPIARAKFMLRLQAAIQEPPITRWSPIPFY